METDKDPTFAEALLAQALWWARCTQLSKMSYSDAEAIARRAVESAPPAIRRALGVDKPPVVEPRDLALKQAERKDDAEGRFEHYYNNLLKALGLPPHPFVHPQFAEQDAERRRSRLEKAEAQAAEARDAFTLAVGERDALRSELDKAKVSRSGLEAYSRQMAKDRDKWNAQCAAAEVECAKLRSERDALAAKLVEAEADIAGGRSVSGDVLRAKARHVCRVCGESNFPFRLMHDGREEYAHPGCLKLEDRMAAARKALDAKEKP